MENAVEKALRMIAGTDDQWVFKASVKTGIHPATLYKWLNARRIKDGAKAVAVSRATGGRVSIEDLVGYDVKSTATSCDAPVSANESQVAA